jgi:AP-1-like factor
VPLDPKQKRKAQNRAAQRAFRDRKEKHVAELQARIDELEALHAIKDEDLVKENQRLKEMLQKVQEENYALKGAQFTFEFPVTDTLPSTVTMNNVNEVHNAYQNTSVSSMSSDNSYSGEDAGSSTEQSPLSNSHTHEDDSTASADTPIATNSLFTSEPMQFGLIQPNALDFLAVSDNMGGLGNGFTTSNNFPTSEFSTNEFPTGDLFHGKDDLFTNYRLPTNTTNDDFLFANEDLTGLFGGTDDLFGFNTNFNAQFGIPETPTTRRYNIPAEKKQYLVDKLRQGQQEGKYIYQVHQEIQQNCPDFNLDALCDDLKKKAKCSLSTFPITDQDVDAFVKCLDRVS